MVQSIKSGTIKICGRQPLKNLKVYGLPKQTIRQTIPLQIFQGLSSTNFTWSILEYFAPYVNPRQLQMINFIWKMKVETGMQL